MELYCTEEDDVSVVGYRKYNLFLLLVFSCALLSLTDFQNLLYL